MNIRIRKKNGTPNRDELVHFLGLGDLAVRDCAATRPNVASGVRDVSLATSAGSTPASIEPALRDLLVRASSRSQSGSRSYDGVLRVVVNRSPSAPASRTSAGISTNANRLLLLHALRQLDLDVVGRAAGGIDPARQEVRARLRASPLPDFAVVDLAPPARAASYSDARVVDHRERAVLACRRAARA